MYPLCLAHPRTKKRWKITCIGASKSSPPHKRPMFCRPVVKTIGVDRLFNGSTKLLRRLHRRGSAKSCLTAASHRGICHWSNQRKRPLRSRPRRVNTYYSLANCRLVTFLGAREVTSGPLGRKPETSTRLTTRVNSVGAVLLLGY